MEIGKIGKGLQSLNRIKTSPDRKPDRKEEKGSISDKVDLSTEAGKKKAVAMAREAITGFKSSLIDTLSTKKNAAGGADLYKLTGTPIELFIEKRFSNLTPETKSEFMQMFQTLSRTSGGLAPASLIDKTFGTSGGFGGMIDQIGKSLNRYLV